MASIMRSKYHTYPEYHTSLDNLEFVTPSGLFGGFSVVKKVIESIECNMIYKSTYLCEPQLGKRGLYPNLGGADTYKKVQDRMNVLAYADGVLDLLSIADKLGVSIWDLHSEALILKEAGLLKVC
jgi:aminopeptidase-like protein